ncbi:MAG: hypothetical protein ACRC7V_01465 [Lachnospiraceae bacterium]
MNYNDVLKRFKYESDVNIKERIVALDKENYRENRDIINSIVLWKLNRSIFITDETLDLLNQMDTMESPADIVKKEKVSILIKQLLSSKGIKLAVASTILHFYYPNIFPIIDQRSYRELLNEEFPNYTSKDSVDKYTTLYIDYILRCYEYNKNNCPEIPFEYIDKILYQIDKEKGNKIK